MSSDVQVQNFSIKKLFGLNKKLCWAADVNELGINQFKLVHIKNKNILLCRSTDGYYAISESCAHRGTPLAGGVMVENTFQCLKHGCRYDIKTGRLKYGPGKKDLETYNVVIQEDDIFIEY